MREKIREFRSRYKQWEPIIFFTAGFLFDVFFNERIDNHKKLALQMSFICIISTFLYLQYKEEKGKLQLHGRLHKLWHYQLELVHFLFGSLLSAFVIFYFRSATFSRSVVFMLLLVALLLLNEVPRFRALGLRLRVTLLSFCAASFLIYFLPVLAGFIQAWLFLVSIAVSGLIAAGVLWFMARIDPPEERKKTFARFGIPVAIVHVVLLISYFTKIIPPVPLSMTFGGIYHKVEKAEGDFKLYSLKPWYNFWTHGDKNFLARNGEPIYCFVRIFAPTQFSHRVYLRWMLYDDRLKRYMQQDHIGMQISGGREEGFRGYAFKSHYQPGEWRVDVETEDERVIGSIHFTVNEDTSTDERIWMIDEG